MEIKAFVEDFDHCRKTSLYNTFAVQLFAVHLLPEDFIMAHSMKLEIVM